MIELAGIRSAWALVSLLLALGVAVPGAEAGARRTEVFTIPSGRGPDYAIWISRPIDTTPPGPIAYVLDGNRFFASLLDHFADPGTPETTRRATIVGIGYATSDASAIERRRMEDFSTPADIRRLAAHIQAMEPRLGGLEGFLQRLRDEIVPRVEALYGGGVTCRVVGGHSMGGFAVLNALFGDQRFDAYVAVSPSIFWNEREILERRLPEGRAVRSLRLYVGGEEQTPPPHAPPDVVARVERLHMIDNVIDLADRLNVLRPGLAGVEVVPGANHDSVALPALERGLDAALADCAD